MPDVRLIDGAELKKHIESTICYGCQIGHMIPPCSRCYVSTVLRYIDEMPEVDAQPVKHGHWINHFDDLFPEESTIECSVCHEHSSADMTYDNFCPNCGSYNGGE